MHGYSDRINHAFAFAAKHRRSPRPQGPGMVHVAHHANVAVILAFLVDLGSYGSSDRARRRRSNAY